jgi:hypothetical protein
MEMVLQGQGQVATVAMLAILFPIVYQARRQARPGTVQCHTREKLTVVRQ